MATTLRHPDVDGEITIPDKVAPFWRSAGWEPVTSEATTKTTPRTTRRGTGDSGTGSSTTDTNEE